MVLCVQDSTELNYTSQPGIAGLGPLSDLRQHGLYVHPTLAVTPDGVPLGCWMPGCGRATGRPSANKRHWPIEAKESMRWLEGFARCAELAETLPDTRLIYVADRECDIHEFMVRARREPGIDWLIRATPRPLPGRGRQAVEPAGSSSTVGRGRVHPPGPAEPTEPAGGADGAGRTGHLVA